MTKIIADLRERITFLVAARKQDQLGGYLTSWARKQTVWAHIIAQVKCPSWKDKKGWDNSIYKIRIRGDIQIKPSMRIKWGSKLLKIITEPISTNNIPEYVEFKALQIQKGSSDNE